MTEIKRKQAAAFVEDKGTFAGNSPEKKASAQKGQPKKSGAHQPRDGNNVLHQENRKTGQGADFGRNDRKTEPEKTFGQGDQRAESGGTFSRSVQKPPQKSASRKTDRKNSIRKKILLDRVTKRGKMGKLPMSIKTVLNKPPMNIKTVLNKPPMNAKMVFPRLETLLRRKPTKIRENSRQSGRGTTVTAAGTHTDSQRKKENTAGVNIRTGSAPKLPILSVTFRRKMARLQRMVLFPKTRTKNRSFPAAKN